MRRFLLSVCIMLFVAGCATSGQLTVVSPSTPEEELKERVRETLDAREQAAPAETTMPREEVPAEKTEEAAIPVTTEKTAPSGKTVPSSETSVSRENQADTAIILDAMINLMVKKGLMSREELSAEIEELRRNIR